jgi:hypothetical protein
MIDKLYSYRDKEHSSDTNNYYKNKPNSKDQVTKKKGKLNNYLIQIDNRELCIIEYQTIVMGIE